MSLSAAAAAPIAPAPAPGASGLHASLDDVIVRLIRRARDAPARDGEAALVQDFRWRFLVLLTASRLDYDAFSDAFSDKPL